MQEHSNDALYGSDTEHSLTPHPGAGLCPSTGVIVACQQAASHCCDSGQLVTHVAEVAWCSSWRQ